MLIRSKGETRLGKPVDSPAIIALAPVPATVQTVPQLRGNREEPDLF